MGFAGSPEFVYAEALQCRGDVLLVKKDFTRAIADYTLIIDAIPLEPRALYGKDVPGLT